MPGATRPRAAAVVSDNPIGPLGRPPAMSGPGARRVAVLALSLAAALSGCTQAGRSTPEAPSSNRAAALVTASRQTPDEAAQTLASLRRIDDLPLYSMTYVGAYDAWVGRPAPATPSPFGCSLFVASGDPRRLVFGRNFDWQPNPALVLATDPPNGYASISMVDISYVGVGADSAGDRRLLDAPLLPFDGMNERGLIVGLAADESATVVPDPGKPTVGGVRILRLVLDQAATVDEAVVLFDRHNLDFGGGPPLHYLLADATGASAVVEFVDGRMVVLWGPPRGQALTNIRLTGVDEAQRRADRRYGSAAGAVDAADGRLDWRQAMGVLRAVAQPHTRWSVTYEPSIGAVHVVAGQRWTAIHEFSLAMR